MADPMANLQGVRQSLEFVLQTLQSPNPPPFCQQAYGVLQSALRNLQQLSAPGQDARHLAAQIMTEIRQAHQILQPNLYQSPAWPNVDRSLQGAFNALSPIVAMPQAPPVPQAPYGVPQAPYGVPQAPYGVPQAPYGVPQGQAAQRPKQQPIPMQNRNDWAVALLIMRHLYDGDVIDWPLADDHPKRPIFQQLESLGYIARWDRTWPLHDRYRLTEKGIREIEQHYRPADADRILSQVRQAKAATPKARQKALRSLGVDPWHWTILHDPYTHWSTWDSDPGYYYRDVYQASSRRRHHHHEESEPIQEPLREERDLVVPLDEPVGVGYPGLFDAPGRDLS